MLDEPITYDEMYKAYEDCRKRKKNTNGAIKFEEFSYYSIQTLTDEINNRKYSMRPHECFIVKYPVPREVFCANFRDRIVQHFLYNELNPVIEKMLIQNTASCRIKKGTDFAIKMLQRFVRRETDNYKHEAFYGKFDLSGFFMSLDRKRVLYLMVDVVKTKYKGKHRTIVIYLLEVIILTDVTINAKRISSISDWDLIPPHKTLFGNDHGLPIGNITSQLFANYYLNDMDHLIKLRHKSYIRFVDDFVIVDKSKEKIIETCDIIDQYLPTINQKLNKKKTIIRSVKYGIDFLGVVVKPYYTCLSKRRINRLYFTSRSIKDPDKLLMSANSHKGAFNRYHGHNVAYRWYESRDESFKDVIEMNNDCKCIDKRKSEANKYRMLNLCEVK